MPLGYRPRRGFDGAFAGTTRTLGSSVNGRRIRAAFALPITGGGGLARQRPQPRYWPESARSEDLWHCPDGRFPGILSLVAAEGHGETNNAASLS